MNFGLGRTARLSNLVSQKYHQQTSFQPPWKVVHIAGTNGKGSVAAYLAALLRRISSPQANQIESSNRLSDGQDRGLLIGRYTSPHLIDRWDCIVVNDKPVAEDVFKRAEAEVKVLAQQVERETYEDNKERLAANHNTTQQPSSGSNKDMLEVFARDARPTEFEVLTATAFKIFSDPDPTPCDIAVIECGLGGQEDATNILPASAKAVTIITRIGLDHVGILGGNLRSIVRAKCGILRAGVPVVVDGENSEEVLGMIQEEVQQRFGPHWAGNMLFYARGTDLKPYLDQTQQDFSNTSTDTNNHNQLRYPKLQSLLPHQLTNLATAVKTFELLKQLNVIPSLNTANISDTNDTFTTTAATSLPHLPLSPFLLEQILTDTSTSYPARLQQFHPGWLDTVPSQHHNQIFPTLNTHPLLLDGAHNEQSALVLRDYITRETHRTQPPRPTIYILALSSTKPPVEILRALFPDTGTATSGSEPSTTPSTKIIFTGFSTPNSMPWVSATPHATLLSVADQLNLSEHVVGSTSNIVEALDLVESLLQQSQYTNLETETQKPLIVVVGSLYLASDFLRFLRDGRDKFQKHVETLLG